MITKYNLIRCIHHNSEAKKSRACQPNDSLLQGVRDTANNVYNAAVREGEEKGLTGTVGVLVRQFPPTLIQPVIIATGAASNVISGMRNQIQPDAHKEDLEKWKTNK